MLSIPSIFYLALPDIEVHLLASSPDPIWSNTLHVDVPGLTNTGVFITPTHTLANAPPLDVLIVGGGYGSLGLLTGTLDPEVAFIKAVYPSVKYLFLVCTGNALSAVAVRSSKPHFKLER